MKVFVPSLATPPLGDQPATVRFVFSCNAQPVKEYGQETFTLYQPTGILIAGTKHFQTSS